MSVHQRDESTDVIDEVSQTGLSLTQSGARANRYQAGSGSGTAALSGSPASRSFKGIGIKRQSVDRAGCELPISVHGRPAADWTATTKKA